MNTDTDDDVAEAEVVPDGPTTANASGTDLVRVTPGLMEPVAPLDTIRGAFRAYTDAVEHLTDAREDYQNIRGKIFPKKSALRKLGTAFGVSSEIVSREVNRDELGRVQWAEFIVRASAPNGRATEAFGECSLYEKCCHSSSCSSRASGHKHCDAIQNHDPGSHFSHPNHDVPATAETRARNRAFSDLFAMGQVTAEEVGDPPIWEVLGYASEAGFRNLMDPLHTALKADADLAAKWKAWRTEHGVDWPVPNAYARDVRIWMQHNVAGQAEHEYGEQDRPAGREGPVSTPGTGGHSSTPAAPPDDDPAGESPAPASAPSRAVGDGMGDGGGEATPAPAEPSSSPPPDRSGTATKAQMQRLAIGCNELAGTTMNTADLSNDEFRHAVVDAATSGGKQRATSLTKRECAHVIDVLGKLERGEVRIVLIGEKDGRLAELSAT